MISAPSVRVPSSLASGALAGITIAALMRSILPRAPRQTGGRGAGQGRGPPRNAGEPCRRGPDIVEGRHATDIWFIVHLDSVPAANCAWLRYVTPGGRLMARPGDGNDFYLAYDSPRRRGDHCRRLPDRRPAH